MFSRFFSFFVSLINAFERRFGSKSCIAYFVLQTILLSLVNFLIKLLSNVPAFEIIYLRTVLIYLLNFMIMNQYSIDPYPEDQRKMKFLILRGIFNYLSTIFYVLSIKLLLILEATTLFYTFSIWMGFLSWFLLSEKLTKYEIFSSIFALAGIIFVIRPIGIFGLGNEETSEEYYWNFWGCCAGLSAAICYTVLFILIKRTKTQLNVFIYNQIYNLINLAISPIGIFYSGFVWIGWEECGLIVFMGLLHYCSQLCFNRGVQLEKTGKTSFLGYLQIALSFGFDVILGNYWYFTSIIGGVLVFLSSIFMVLKPDNKKK